MFRFKPEHVGLHQKHLGECTAEDCIGCDATKLDDTQSSTGICPNHEKNPSQFRKKKESKWGWSCHHSPVLTQKEEAIMLERWHFTQELSTVPLLDTTPIFDANLPSGGVAFNLNNGMQQMVDRQHGKYTRRRSTTSAIQKVLLLKSSPLNLTPPLKSPYFTMVVTQMQKALFYSDRHSLLGSLSSPGWTE